MNCWSHQGHSLVASTRFEREQRALRSRLPSVLRDIFPHELAYDLGGRLVLGATHFEEFVPKAALDPDTEAHIF